MSRQTIIELCYLVAAVLFILGLKLLGRASTARRGNAISAVGMALAIAGTALMAGLSYEWILVGAVVGSAAGLLAAERVAMTEMPQMVALLNGLGGLASLIVGVAEYQMHADLDPGIAVATGLTVLIGGVTFTGSLVAYAKLAGRMSGKPVIFKGQIVFNAALLLASVALVAIFAQNPAGTLPFFIALNVLSLVLGVALVLPIGGADAPVAVALLNSYSGLAAAAAGFVLLNTVLIVAGTLVGASGVILTSIMCKAMNRSLLNVLFAGVGADAGKSRVGLKGEARPISVEDAYHVLEAARSVVFVPGYGMAVAQAQHPLRELAELLKGKGADVKYCIHPVAGRMPGHMNVLLAEANVDYAELVEPQDVNPLMESVDVAMVIGANDVVNPSARSDKSSPLYGMPIIEVDRARTVIVLKRSLGAGFAGVDNQLFVLPNTRMLLGDAKASLQALVRELKAE